MFDWLFWSRFHKWVYRNPYDRTCSRCGRNEVEHLSCSPSNPRNSWWEVFSEGKPASCNKRPAEPDGGAV